MGSKDDNYFVQRSEAGKKEVFFAINSPDHWPWVESFACVVRERNLRPVCYSGARRKIIPPPGKSNTSDNELNDDFYPAKIKVLYFGEAKKGSDYEDHWVLSALAHIHAGDKLLVYVSKDYPVEVLKQYGFKGTPIVVSNHVEFKKSLHDLLLV